MTKVPFAKCLSPKFLSLVLTLAVLGLAPVASAGLQLRTVFCEKYADGSGVCYGNFLGFREDATLTSSASFRDDLAGTRSFYARATTPGATTETIYTCIAGAEVSPLWEQALSARGFFRVSWDASGTCNYLRLVNGSLDTNF